jgi:hypothetical protein
LLVLLFVAAVSTYRGNTGEKKKEENDGENQKQDEENLGNPRRASRDTGKAQGARNERDQKEYDGPLQHEGSLPALYLPFSKRPVEAAVPF